MYVVIIGCGRAGSSLANLLSRQGSDVVVIDKEPEALQELAPEYSGFKIRGDATEIEVLKEAKMDKANVVVITTDDDNVNAMIAQIAKNIYNIPQVLVRVNDPAKEIIYHDLDVYSISTTNLLVDKFNRQIKNN